MRKKYLCLLIALLCIYITSCNQNKNNLNINSNNNIITQEPVISPKTDNNKEPSVESVMPSDNINTETASTTTPKVNIGKLSLSQQYSDINKTIKILGLKEYTKIKGKDYTDKAKKGNIFLVIFLSIKNDTIENYYLNYNYLSAKVDGKNIKHTFLINEPRNYPTIFTNIEAGKTVDGFIVWEVPKKWKKFELNYNGWKDIDNVSIEAVFTPKDLSNPPIYNTINYK